MQNKSYKLRKILEIGVWVISILLLAMSYYVNNYTPQGPSYWTGDFNCQGGKCAEQYKEDYSHLNLPWWITFFKNHELIMLLWMGTSILGAYISTKNKEDSNN